MPTLPQNKAVGKTKPLSERLRAIASALPRGGVVCDIGSDHGALCRYLLERGHCRHCIVTDLNEAPLQRARNNLTDAGYSDLCTFLLSDGLNGIFLRSDFSVVIAGMGAETIAGILQRDRASIPVGTLFVLQPMTKETLLRRYLYENGFFVENETVVSENGREFIIFIARYDATPRFREDSFWFLGEHLPRADSRAVILYLKRLQSQLERMIVGRKRAGVDVSDLFEQKQQIRLILEENDED